MIGAAALRALIAHHPSRPLRNTYFRAMGLRHHADPLGRGRPIARQRFNVENGARILYVGDDPITCLHEVQAFGFPVTSIAIVPVQLELNAVLDLRDAALRHELAITEEDVAFNFRAEPRGSPPTDMERLGEALAASRRADGLLYESLARPGSACLAILEAGVAALGSTVAVRDPQNALAARLP
jgi:RES domain-containing protein